MKITSTAFEQNQPIPTKYRCDGVNHNPPLTFSEVPAVGDTREEVEKNMREAIKMHIQGMIEDQEPIPLPQSTAEYMDVSIPDSAA